MEEEEFISSLKHFSELETEGALGCGKKTLTTAWPMRRLRHRGEPSAS